jgi:hypothetical protein
MTLASTQNDSIVAVSHYGRTTVEITNAPMLSSMTLQLVFDSGALRNGIEYVDNYIGVDGCSYGPSVILGTEPHVRYAYQITHLERFPTPVLGLRRIEAIP